MSDERSLAEALTQRPAQVGDVIGGRFRIESELGSGGMARVFRVTDIAGEGTFALKLLRPEIANDEEAIARLRREGELLDRLDNPAIVGIETYGKLTDGRLFLVMELLEGQTLGELMRDEGRLNPETLTPVVTGVAAGLHAAHEADVVHRDLKPDNIFLTRVQTGSGVATQVKILDFGISKAVGFERLTRTGQVLGTPRYMAPEQLAADHDLDARVDVYALGVMLYEALAGQPPFVAVSPSDLIVAILHGKVTPLRVYRPELSDEVVAVVTRAMARARDARYGSARELAEAWIEAAQPRGGGRPAGSKRGMRTRALGGASPVSRGDEEGPDSLRLGTFSALEPSAPIAAPARSSADDTPTVGARGVAHRAARPADDSPPAEAARPDGQLAASAAPLEPGDDFTGTLRLPLANRRLWLLIIALLAGALTALAVILMLRSLREEPDPATIEGGPSVGAIAPAVPAMPAAMAAVESDAPRAHEDSEGADEAALPVAAEPPPDDEPPRRPRSRRSSRPANGPSEGAAALPAPSVETVSPGTAMTEGTPLQRARAALASGNPRECIQLLEGFGASAPVLKLRADCQLRAGDRSRAVKTYERFCQRYGNHPAIAEVRAVVTRNGGRCPEPGSS